MKKKVVLVCGSRTFKDYNTIYRELARLPEGTIILHGAARGADSLARDAAVDLGLLTYGVPAQWHLYGKAAGFVRNKYMLEAKPPDACLAFHDKRRIKDSKGTYDMVKRCRKKGIPVRVYGRDTTVRDTLKWKKEPLL